MEGILSRPDLTSNGKFVLGKVDILSAVDYVKLWGKVTGNEVEVVEASIEDVDKVFPTWSREMGTMLEYWNWTRVEGLERLSQVSWTAAEICKQPWWPVDAKPFTAVNKRHTSTSCSSGSQGLQ